MKRNKQLNNAELSTFFNQMALILNAGITPYDGIAILLADTKEEDGRKVLQTLLNHAQLGESLYECFMQTEVFPEYVLNMIHIGEESGRLEEVMDSLAAYYEREESINTSIKSAISYPIIMIGMMVLVILVLLTKVMPIFNQVFIQLGTQMNGLSKSLMNLGSSINKYSVLLICIVCFLVLLYFFISKSKIGKELFNSFFTKIPFTKDVYFNIAAGKFASGMALTLSSGLDTSQSLLMLYDLIEHPDIKLRIQKCIVLFETGCNFSDSLAHSNIFSNLYVQMIAVGFNTGNLDIVMKKIAQNYETETDRKIYQIISILEPTLVIILSIIVGMILLSVIMPLMGIMSNIG